MSPLYCASKYNHIGLRGKYFSRNWINFHLSNLISNYIVFYKSSVTSTSTYFKHVHDSMKICNVKQSSLYKYFPIGTNNYLFSSLTFDLLVQSDSIFLNDLLEIKTIQRKHTNYINSIKWSYWTTIAHWKFAHLYYCVTLYILDHNHRRGFVTRGHFVG